MAPSNPSVAHLLPITAEDELPLAKSNLMILAQMHITRTHPLQSVLPAWPAFRLRGEASLWRFEALSVRDQVLALIAASYAARVTPEYLPLFLSLDTASQNLLGPMTSQQLILAAVTKAQTAGYYSAPSRDAVEVLAVLGAALSGEPSLERALVLLAELLHRNGR